MSWQTNLGQGLGAAAGGVGGFFLGGPMGAFGGASLGAGLGGAIGSEFSPSPGYQQIGGLSDEQIQALIEVQRARGLSSINAASGHAMQLGANTAAGNNTYGSGLMSRRFGEIAGEAGSAAGNLEGSLGQMMASLYAGQQFAPPPPSFGERVSPALTQIGAPLLAQAMMGGMAPPAAPGTPPPTSRVSPFGGMDPARPGQMYVGGKPWGGGGF